MRRALIASPRFLRRLKRLVQHDKEAARAVDETIRLLSDNAFHPSLKIHKLKGTRSEIWSCSAGYDRRIIFEFIKDDAAEMVHLLTVGTHDEVY